MSGYLAGTSLGKETTYVDRYDPNQLFPIERHLSRKSLGIDAELPFTGEDIWNAYELSWLDATGKPQVAMAEVRIPAESPYLVESKSFKLYLNSFANTRFSSWGEVSQTIAKDISATAGALSTVKLLSLAEAVKTPLWENTGICLDDLALLYPVDEEIPADRVWLRHEPQATEVTETFYSHLVRSLCPVTGQPDWATVEISYQGLALCPQHLLQYLVNFRQASGFHEHVVEQTYQDIMATLKPSRLYVRARYTRRGGLDINPYRSSYAITLDNKREVRQ